MNGSEYTVSLYKALFVLKSERNLRRFTSIHHLPITFHVQLFFLANWVRETARLAFWMGCEAKISNFSLVIAGLWPLRSSFRIFDAHHSLKLKNLNLFTNPTEWWVAERVLHVEWIQFINYNSIFGCLFAVIHNLIIMDFQSRRAETKMCNTDWEHRIEY